MDTDELFELSIQDKSKSMDVQPPVLQVQDDTFDNVCQEVSEHVAQTEQNRIALFISLDT